MRAGIRVRDRCIIPRKKSRGANSREAGAKSAPSGAVASRRGDGGYPTHTLTLACSGRAASHAPHFQEDAAELGADAHESMQVAAADILARALEVVLAELGRLPFAAADAREREMHGRGRAIFEAGASPKRAHSQRARGGRCISRSGSPDDRPATERRRCGSNAQRSAPRAAGEQQNRALRESRSARIALRSSASTMQSLASPSPSPSGPALSRTCRASPS